MFKNMWEPWAYF